MTFREMLHQAREVTLGAISHDEVPLEAIAERIGLSPDPSRNPFFTVTLSVAPDVAPLPPGWEMTFMDVESGGSRWDLYFELSDRAEGMMGRAQYNPEVFSLELVKRTLDDLQHLLRHAVVDPGQTIKQLVNVYGGTS